MSGRGHSPTDVHGTTVISDNPQDLAFDGPNSMDMQHVLMDACYLPYLETTGERSPSANQGEESQMLGFHQTSNENNSNIVSHTSLFRMAAY